VLDLKFVREHWEEVKEKVGRRGQAIDWDSFARLDAERREILRETESLRAQRNQVSDLIAGKKKKKEDASPEIAQMKEVSSRVK
jgi:seryl-tRNA synthetase